MDKPHDERMEEPRRRKRIVIDFSARPAKSEGSRNTGHSSWLRLIVLTVVFLIAIGALALTAALFWWRHYQTTPPYSLAVLIDAAQRNDSQTLDQIIDTDQIMRNLGNQVTEKSVARYGITLSPLLRKRVEALVPGLMPSVRSIVREAVAQRVRELAEVADHKPFIVTAVSLPYVVNISTQADTAVVNTTIDEKVVELTMQRDGASWRVTSVKDDAMVQRVVDELIKDLPAIGRSN